jgi:transcription antitermination factor NusA-like protein
MSYYKIGDRVKVIQVPADNKDVAVGDEGNMVNLISAHLYRIKFDDGSTSDLKAHQFEKIR